MAKKTELSKKEILHLAHLARLTLNEAEIETYQRQLGETIEYVKNLDELDTTPVKPTNSVVDLKNVSYEDGTENRKELSVAEAVSNAKHTKDTEFVVDRIME